jgi:hypothetical protein
MGDALRYVAALNGQDATAGATTLYCPQYAVGGPWRSALSVVNLDPIAGLVSFRFIPEDPSQTGATEVVPIPAYGKIYIDDPSFFRFLSVGRPGLVTQGYVEITSDGIRLAGSVVFGDVERTAFSSALPLVSTLERTLIFSHIASDDTYFTGLAIVNPNEADTLAAVSLYGADGKLEASATQLIPAKGRVSRLLTEYFPALAGQNRASGYIRVSADKGVASFALFGTHRLSVLSAIPAQVIK